ncbi:saccharopine dehydrogenase [NADP(+), L-glutamate-forming] [Colletotrichum spaethianum]|uniref:Saccharopine dehydrogenase [NADP(+), L-glutamate-forming] n=1 Tax=Colletotrichum spaethianum TaxID=700344 RepID=A0AA37P024_9PEZI|nr:saccharopine dehydrogenase [NADP(+), L-glutamate-forming] [Colletotrichum spaethianum]GKT45065.1 saccharopine dehydrogenase [NADP(+), L-glutamate-forming] [Colletotrichum spaethianum]
MVDKKILVLGSGLVAKPCVDYLLRNERNKLTIACRTRSTAQSLASNHPRATAIALDVASTELDAHVAAHDLVISLVPFIHHPVVIKAGIRGNTHVVTTSYVSPAIKELEDEAKAAGITVLNEVGVDPGVDHLYAIKTIGEVHSKGGKIKEFHSYCGGLPAPECADNPLRFKFSWSPRGALLSQFNSASYLQDGKEIEISNQDLMAQATPYYVADGYSFVAYPNRNSVPFREFYNIPEAETVVRGSLRYEGNPSFVAALITLGWLNTQSRAWLEKESGGLTLREVFGRTISSHGSDEESLITRIDELCGFSDNVERERIISGLRWIGLFSETPATLRGNLLDTLCAELERLMSFQPGERDLVMLQHKFVIQWEDGRKETRTSTLELLGDPDGHSAMAKSVGVTCGIATQLLIDGEPALNVPGVLAPYTAEICDPIRDKLEEEGIKLIEKTL